MEQEYLEYRQQSLKGKLAMSKRFTKFYFKNFRPITQLEKSDLDRARNTYNGFTFFGALTLGYMSFRYRRMRISMIEPHEAPKNVNAFQMMHVFNDAVSAFLGFTMGNLIACDYIYKRRIYIVERLHFEKQNNFNRYTFEVDEGHLPDEYPFADYITLKDKEIVEDRVHPREIEQQTEQIKERMEQIQQEYQAKQ